MRKRYLYAQLALVNDVQTVVAMSDLCHEVNQANLIKLQSLSMANLGDIYQDGQFITPAPEVAE